jgi:membrane protease YdiL (CAAX protease family)
VVATSAVFGLLHGPSASLPIFGLSLILGGVMLRTQRLLAPCLIHMLHNGLMVFLLLGSDALRDTLVT